MNLLSVKISVWRCYQLKYLCGDVKTVLGYLINRRRTQTCADSIQMRLHLNALNFLPSDQARQKTAIAARYIKVLLNIWAFLPKTVEN
jgi:hypothetical protein